MFDFKVLADMKHPAVFPVDHDYTDLDIKIETVEHGKRVAKYICESTPELGDSLYHIDIEWQCSINVKFDFKDYDSALVFRHHVLEHGYKAVSILKYVDCDYYTVEIRSSVELFVGEWGKKFGVLLLGILRDFAPKAHSSVSRIYTSVDSSTIVFIDPLGYAQALSALEHFAEKFSKADDVPTMNVIPTPVHGVALGEYAIMINFEDR